jgi:transitional endoplasmic reticulum ATPase
MDGLKSRGDVIVMAATNRPNSIDPALRRPGRFDREIVIGIPNARARREILEIHARGMPLAGDVDLGELADAAHGFTGADLGALCTEAGMAAMRRHLPGLQFGPTAISTEVLMAMEVGMTDFTNAVAEVEPSGLREVAVEVPNVRWDEVGGLEAIKTALQECIAWPMSQPRLFQHVGLRPPHGILLYGPPGNGKTLVVKALASQSNLNFISVKGPELLSKYVGESERGVRELFARARQAAPCIVFLDEVDALVPRRGLHNDSPVTDRVVSQLLTEIDGIETLKDVWPARLSPGGAEAGPVGARSHRRGTPAREAGGRGGAAGRSGGTDGRDVRRRDPLHLRQRCDERTAAGVSHLGNGGGGSRRGVDRTERFRRRAAKRQEIGRGLGRAAVPLILMDRRRAPRSG